MPGRVGDEAQGKAEAEADGGIDVDGDEVGVEIIGSGIDVGTGWSKQGG
jgi:hypothetical protein